MSETANETVLDSVGELVSALTRETPPEGENVQPESQESAPEEGTTDGEAADIAPWQKQFGPDADTAKVYEAYENLRSMNDRRFTEAQQQQAELEARLAQYEQYVLSQQQQAPPPVGLEDVDSLDVNKVQQLAGWALQNGRQDVWDDAIVALHELEAPHIATRLEVARLDWLRSQQQAAVQAQEQQAQQQFLTAWDSFKTEHPDLDDMGPAMLQIANEQPMLNDMFLRGQPEQRAQIIQILYDAARGRSGQPPSPQGSPAQAPYVAGQNNVPTRDASPPVHDPLGIQQYVRDFAAEDAERRASLYNT